MERHCDEASTMPARKAKHTHESQTSVKIAIGNFPYRNASFSRFCRDVSSPILCWRFVLELRTIANPVSAQTLNRFLFNSDASDTGKVLFYRRRLTSVEKERS
jgi:hypothetical protein